MRRVRPQSLHKTAESLVTGKITAAQAVSSALDRIMVAEPDIHAWVVVDAAGAMAAAARLDLKPASERGPLHGVPIGVKDIIDVAGLPTRCGSQLRGGSSAAVDSAIVARLRGLGAIIIGKTVTTEFAYFSPGPTTNPQDTARTPGGSSSGSAAAVAAGMVPLAIGTQTAASVSRPAAYCGVTGYVTARGTLPEGGITGLTTSFDTIGFFTADVQDMDFLRRVLESIDDPSTRADLSQSSPAGILSGGAQSSIPATVFSWSPGDDFGVEPVMHAALEKAERALSALGHTVVRLDFDARAAELVSIHTAIMGYEAVRLRRTEAAQPEGISPHLADLFDSGRSLSDADCARLHKDLTEQRRWIRKKLSDGGLLLAPAAQGVAPEGISATGAPVMSRPWQALGLPVLILPGLSDPDSRLPLGLQLAALPRLEENLFAVASRLQPRLRSGTL